MVSFYWCLSAVCFLTYIKHKRFERESSYEMKSPGHLNKITVHTLRLCYIGLANQAGQQMLHYGAASYCQHKAYIFLFGVKSFKFCLGSAH
jgi:hypothetical protein